MDAINDKREQLHAICVRIFCREGAKCRVENSQ